MYQYRNLAAVIDVPFAPSIYQLEPVDPYGSIVMGPETVPKSNREMLTTLFPFNPVGYGIER